MPFDPNAEILPQELFNLVIEFTQDDRRTLCDLCLVSKAFLTDSQRFLYKRVGLGGIRVTRDKSDGWGISNANNDTVFFRTLACIPHLSHYVRDFSFRPDTRYRGNQFWSFFHQALHQMVNLRSLQLTLMTTDPSLFRILEELSDNPFQLETFSWKDYRWTMTANESMALLSFLFSQPSLRALDVVSSSPSLALPQTHCPNLSTFIGSFEMALSVLPERAITNFVWTGGQHEPTSHPSTYWQAELSRLRVLIFRDYFPVTINLEDLVSCLQSLEAIQISYEHDFPNESALKEVTELLRHLPALKNLRMLVCAGFIPLESQGASSQSGLGFETTSDLFDSSPSLRYIYYSEQNTPGSQERYLRWTRGTTRPVEVGADVLADSYRSLGFNTNLLDRRAIFGL